MSSTYPPSYPKLPPDNGTPEQQISKGGDNAYAGEYIKYIEQFAGIGLGHDVAVANRGQRNGAEIKRIQPLKVLDNVKEHRPDNQDRQTHQRHHAYLLPQCPMFFFEGVKIFIVH